MSSSSPLCPDKSFDKQFDELISILIRDDGSRRAMIDPVVSRLEKLKARDDNPNAIILGGFKRVHSPGEDYRHFAEAEEKGADHPVLCYLLGECFEIGKGVKANFKIALQYYTQGIKSTFISCCNDQEGTLYLPPFFVSLT